MIALPILDVFLALVVSASSATHPHNPMAFQLAGAKGKATLSYFTLPYNPEAVKTLQPGTDWYLGFAQLNTDMDMTCGDVKVPAASYQLNVHRDDDGGFTKLVLKKQSGEDIVLPLTSFEAAEDEHLTFRVMNNGYVAAAMRSTEPAGGAEFSIMVSFGTLHRKFDLREVFETGQK